MYFLRALDKRDETIKRRLYERFGVSEYWVIDPELDTIVGDAGNDLLIGGMGSSIVGMASAHSSRDATIAPAALAKRSVRSSGQPDSRP